MSKNTKIIAIAGGVLIVLGLIYMGASKGGFGSAFEAVGCGGKKGAESPRQKLSQEDMELLDCAKRGFVVKRDDKGNAAKVNKKVVAVAKKGKCFCLKLWEKKCADDKFAAKEKAKCSTQAKKLKAAKDCGEAAEE